MAFVCAYCGKELEPSRARIMVVQRGDRIYCSEECRVRFNAKRIGMTEEAVIEEIRNSGGEIIQSNLFKRFDIKTSGDKNTATRFVSLLVSSGVIEKVKLGSGTVVLRLKSIGDEKVGEVMGVEVGETTATGSAVASTGVDVETEFESVAKIVESVDIGKRIAAIESRVELLEKKVQILRSAIEKLAKAIAGER